MVPDTQAQRECPRCRAIIPPDAAGGVCVSCAFQQALSTPADDKGAAFLMLDDIPSTQRKFADIGDYEIIEVIGRGGMGIVHKARQRSLNRVVALKTILKGLHASEDYKRRFVREAQMAARLQHPNIVSIFDVGEQKGQLYFSMEYVSGTDLGKMAAFMPLRPEEAARYVEAVARAVHYSHEQGILHRDLKPSNILVGHDNRPRITDFGLARQLEVESTMGMSGAILGTPGFAPPEQVSAGRGEVGRTSDVYGLGAILYYVLTSRPPFTASTLADTLKQVQDSEPVTPQQLNPTVPAALQTICLKCLKKSQKNRYQSAEDLADDLRHWIEKKTGRPPGPKPLPEPTRPPESKPPPEPVSPPEPAPSSKSSGHRLWLLLLLLVTLAGAAWWQDWGDIRQRTMSLLQPRDEYASKPLRAGQPRKPEDSSDTNGLAAKPEGHPIGAPPVTDPRGLPAFGALKINLLDNSLSYKKNWPVFYEIRGDGLGTTNIKDYLKTKAKNDEIPLPAGNYVVTLTVAYPKKWVLTAPVEIRANETNIVPFTFAYGKLAVTSDPSGAEVSWPGEANSFGKTHDTTPFTSDFLSGAIPFTIHKRGYVEIQRTNFFYPANDYEKPFDLTLRPILAPVRGKSWTNSLGMVFRWVESQKMWACEVETRVVDFRAFADDAHYDARPGMFSLTSNGWAQLNHSWDSPGPLFSQTEDHPVIGVNWEDATNFCHWLTQHERKLGQLLDDQSYRLPKTNEWFALAHGSIYPWGNDSTPKGNYSGTEVQGPDWPLNWPVLSGHRDKFARTAPVRSPDFAPNDLGFHNLGGNAAEWCEEGVLCGGSWFDGEADGKSDDVEHLKITTVSSRANKYVYTNPALRCDCNGFRVFLDEHPPETRAKR